MPLALLASWLVAAAPPPEAVAFGGGLIDAARGVAFVNVQDPQAATALHAEADPRGSGYLGAHGAIAAIDLATGKRRWVATGASGAFHVTGNTVVAWAEDAEHATLALLDAKTGKRLRTLTLFDVPPPKPAAPSAPCTLEVPAATIVQHRFGGDGDAVWVATNTLVCSAGRARGGARMTDELLAEDAKRCVSSRAVGQWSLTSGKQTKRDAAPAETPTLEQRGRLEVGGVVLTLEAMELVARKGGERTWSVPQAVTSVAVGRPCPAPPGAGRP